MARRRIRIPLDVYLNARLVGQLRRSVGGAEDIVGTIHPHPTFSESLAQASEVAEGTVTELFLGRGKG